MATLNRIPKQPTKIISKDQLARWEELTNDQLYNEIINTANKLFGKEESNIKTMLLQNIRTVKSWARTGDNDKLEQLAKENLVNARLLLAVMEEMTQNYDWFHQYQAGATKHHKFFSKAQEMDALLSGGHFLIADDGRLCQRLYQAKELFKRFSSHYKKEKIAQLRAEGLNENEATQRFNQSTPDFSLRSEVIFNEAVFGTMERNGKTYTWFQFEGHSHQSRSHYTFSILRLLNAFLLLFNYSIEKFHHHIDFLEYVWHGKKRNIGQYGTSEFVESSPLELVETESSQKLEVEKLEKQISDLDAQIQIKEEEETKRSASLLKGKEHKKESEPPPRQQMD